jgi:hypothetical protein
VQFLTYLKAIVRPRPKLHATGLLVKGEEFDIDIARALVDGRWFPFHKTCGPQDRLGFYCDFVAAVSTAGEECGWDERIQ